jgi:hypothetical protein
MGRSCRGQQRVTKTNSRSSVLNIATHKKIFLTPVSGTATTDCRVLPLPLSPGRERERGEAVGRERGKHRSEREEATGCCTCSLSLPSPGASVGRRWWSQARSRGTGVRRRELRPSGPAAALTQIWRWGGGERRSGRAWCRELGPSGAAVGGVAACAQI